MKTSLQLVNTLVVALLPKDTDNHKTACHKIRKRREVTSLAIQSGFHFNRRKGRYE